MNRSLTIALALGLTLLATPSLRADTVYSTVGDQTASLPEFGVDYTATFGETFTAPGEDLQSFTFYTYSTGTTNVTAQVYAWNGNLYGGDSSLQGTGGAVLFSTPVTIANGGGNLTATTVTIGGGGLALTAGNNYIILFTNPDNDNSEYWSIDFFDNPSPSALGGFNFNNGPAGAAAYNSNDINFGTLEYTATFGTAPTPEPNSLILLGTGLLGAGAMLRRRILGC